ncbi:MAG: hypothetical protein M1830_007220 [Pleopsidium flavum]|nr:MAG: hypothetical protein M1830_007220 [Pleopsidium flavum]
MGPALQRLLIKPSALALLGKFITSPDKLLQFTTCHRCPICSPSSRRTALTLVQPPGCGNAEGHEIPSEQGVGITQSDPTDEQRASFRKVRLDYQAGFRHRLSSWKGLQFESDVNNDWGLGSRLVDKPGHSHNFQIWVELLEFRQRMHGSRGVADIWKGIRKRRLKLPSSGPQAETLWNAIIALGFTRPDVLAQVYEYAQGLFEDTGTRWKGLYRTIIAHFVATEPKKVHDWHMRLRWNHSPLPEHVDFIFNEALTNKEALHVFRRVYIELDVRTLYASIVGRLCDVGFYDTAHEWHYLLMQMKDLPSSSTAVEPLMHYLASYGKSDQLRDLTRSMVDAAIPFAASTSKAFRDNEIISREVMNRMLGEAHSITPKKFSDQFCARIFATRAFSIDIVLSGLCFLGMEAIGPLSIREISSRDATPQAIARRMDQLKEIGISLDASTFSKLVRKFALENKTDILNDLLASDQHPDTFEDLDLQESLLASYHEAQDWRKFDMTLAAITAYSNGNTAVATWNLILRSYLTQRNSKAATQTLEDMRLEGIPVSPRSCRSMRSNILRFRREGRRPVSHAGRSDDLGLLISLWQGAIRCGGDLSPLAWKEVFRRLGQTNRLDELEKLALWLTAWYSPKGSEDRRSLLSPHEAYTGIKRLGLEPRELPTSHHRHPYRIIFSTVQQEAIIAWGFKNVSTKASATRRPSNVKAIPSKYHDRHWTWGLKLLLKLKRRGVIVNNGTVGRVIRHRLMILYGDGRSAVRANRVARANNPHALPAVLSEVTAIWGPSVSRWAPRSLNPNPYGQRWLMTRKSHGNRGRRPDTSGVYWSPHGS